MWYTHAKEEANEKLDLQNKIQYIKWMFWLCVNCGKEETSDKFKKKTLKIQLFCDAMVVFSIKHNLQSERWWE